MKKKGKYILLSFIVVSMINAVIFFNRDHFSYHKKASYASLYSPDTLKWKQYVYDYPANELKLAAKLLDDSLKIEAKTSEQKVLEIGSLLFNRFKQQSGRPSDVLQSSSPLQQYQMLSSSKDQKIWCGIYANMFAFFCWAKGIPCRVIEIMNPNDHHVVNECYLAESGQWAMVDLTFNRLLVLTQDKKKYGNFFNFLSPTKENLLSLRADGDSITATEFAASSYNYYLGSNPAVFYYYRINNFEVYKPIEKIKRYVLPVVWYEEINQPKSNFLFYVKEFFLLLWLSNLIVLVIYFVRNKSQTVEPINYYPTVTR